MSTVGIDLKTANDKNPNAIDSKESHELKLFCDQLESYSNFSSQRISDADLEANCWSANQRRYFMSTEDRSILNPVEDPNTVNELNSLLIPDGNWTAI